MTLLGGVAGGALLTSVGHLSSVAGRRVGASRREVYVREHALQAVVGIDFRRRRAGPAPNIRRIKVVFLSARVVSDERELAEAAFRV